MKMDNIYETKTQNVFGRSRTEQAGPPNEMPFPRRGGGGGIVATQYPNIYNAIFLYDIR